MWSQHTHYICYMFHVEEVLILINLFPLSSHPEIIPVPLIHYYIILIGMDFSRDGKYLALAERRDCKDHISIFDPSSWLLIKVS